MTIYDERVGDIRIYDATATPYYLHLILTSGFNGPIGIPSPEEILVLDRGRANEYMHYRRGPDDKVLAEVDISFQMMAEDSGIFGYLLDWLMGNAVNSNTIVTTKGTTQRDGANNNPSFADTNKKCCNVEYRMDLSVDIVWKYNEVYFPLDQQSLAEGADGVPLSLAGKWYGTLTKGSSFTSGTDVTA